MTEVHCPVDLAPVLRRGNIYCSDQCKDSMRRWMNSYYSLRRKQLGICHDCPAKVNGAVRCELCACIHAYRIRRKTASGAIAI